MQVVQLDGYRWTIEPHCLAVRRSGWAFAVNCAVALAILLAPALLIIAVVADPSVHIGATPSSRGSEIAWAQQTLLQRNGQLIVVGLFVLVFTLISLTYLMSICHDQRNPLLFDKSSNQLHKGKKILGRLSATKSIAVVHIARHRPFASGLQAPPQLFIRFNEAPWSFQIHAYSRMITADRVAGLLAEFLSVPVVYDPIVIGLPRSEARRGFPVIMNKEPE